LDASLEIKAEQASVRALEGRRTANALLLPSNPVLSFSMGHRRGPTDTAVNWYATLSQEVEVANQRGTRIKAADAAIQAQQERVAVSRRDAAAMALVAYFEVLSAQEFLRLGEQLLQATARVAETARARADKGLASALDADLADAQQTRAQQAKLAAERALRTANARLASMLGLPADDTGFSVSGNLQPLSGLDAAMDQQAATRRPELRVVESERRAALARTEAMRRARIPNPSVSAFLQNDGFSERVLGVGLSLPLPLPAPLGQTRAGDIAEAEALTQRSMIATQQATRDVALQVAEARAEFETHEQAVRALSPERLLRARASLRDLQNEVEAGRVAVRDALLAQQTLLEMLQADLASRRAWCIASVSLARALGLALEEAR
jgi:cobalt-zinc-cadmium efflux system outer membrane protein